MSLSPQYTSFEAHRRLASGSLEIAALPVKRSQDGGSEGPFLIFDDATGRTVDLDLRGTFDEVVVRLAASDARASHPADDAPAAARGRGRPKLGVVPREVTLLPRHWEWLATQPGGASVALRKLVEQARKSHAETDRLRSAQERAYRFMSTMAGDFPGFEEASRALFANNPPRLKELIAGWPEDVRDHALALAFGEDDPSPSPKG